MNLFKKLSAAESKRLAAFLESVASPPDTMTLMEVKGFLFALCCAPALSKPSEWIPEIFNHRTPNYATTEEEEFITTALVRLYNSLMADVNDGVPQMPSVCKYKEPCSVNFEKGSALHEWSRGFNEAHHLFFDHWEAGVSEDDELMAAVGFMVLTLGFFDDRDESRQMLDMAFDVDLPLNEMAPIVRAQMPQVMKEYARIGRALYDELIEEEQASKPAGKPGAAGSNVVPFRVPHKPEDARDRLLQAEEIAIQALEETNIDKRVALARKALSISDDCARAYSLLAEDAADNLAESAEYYRRAMEAVKRTLGETTFAEAEGHFWGILETRPYMHAKMGYADTLWALERTGEAIHEYEEMLRFNPNDNQGARYVLLIRYLDVGDIKKAKILLDQFPEDSTWWLYTEALYWWMAKGDCAAGRKAREAAIKSNGYVLGYFTGKRRMPKALPEFYAWGSVEEAVLYAHEARTTWRTKPGAVEWLQAGAKASLERVLKSSVKTAEKVTPPAKKNADAKASNNKGALAKLALAKIAKGKAGGERAQGASVAPKVSKKAVAGTKSASGKGTAKPAATASKQKSVAASAKKPSSKTAASEGGRKSSTTKATAKKVTGKRTAAKPTSNSNATADKSGKGKAGSAPSGDSSKKSK